MASDKRSRGSSDGKRVSRRVAVNRPAKVDHEAANQATCRDLSGNGCGLRIEGELPLGSTLSVTIHLPEGPLTVPAEVVRVESEDIGLRLVSLDQGNLSLLHSYLAHKREPGKDT